MLICTMFATRLSPAWCGMYAGALTVALPVVGFSTGVALTHETGQGLGGRGLCGRGQGGRSFQQLL